MQITYTISQTTSQSTITFPLFLPSPSIHPYFVVYCPHLTEILAVNRLLKTMSPFPFSSLAVFFCSLRGKQDEGTGVEEVHNVEERQGDVDWRGLLYGLQRV